MTYTQASRAPQASTALFFAIAAAYCIWIFSFPVFPTQDGPVHLYYTNVLSQVAQGSELFRQYFSVRYPIPPYAIHYLILFALMKIVTPLVAEKIVISAIVLLFAFGARFLFRSLTENYQVAALAALPLSLNWMVGMGFHNYCLSLDLSLFAMGCWLRAAKSDKVTYYIAFVVLIFLMLFTHPVPILLALALATGELIFRVARELLSGKGIQPGRSYLFLPASYCSLLYILLFVSKGRTAENLQHSFIQKDMLLDFLKARPLVMIYGSLGARGYRLWLFALLIGACVAGALHMVRSFRQRRLTETDLLTVGALGLLAAFPVLPRSINGSDYFADRLVLYAWVFALGGGAAALKLSRFQASALALLFSVVAVAVPAIDDREIRAASRHLQRIEATTLPAPGPRGIFIDGPVSPPPSNLTFDPWVWSSARYFRATHTVMMNAPWLDLPILPIAPRGDLLVSLLPPNINNYPDHFLEKITKSEQMRALLSKHSDFLIQIGYSGSAKDAEYDAFSQKWPHPWNCERSDWYAVCKAAAGY